MNKNIGGFHLRINLPDDVIGILRDVLMIWTIILDNSKIFSFSRVYCLADKSDDINKVVEQGEECEYLYRYNKRV